MKRVVINILFLAVYLLVGCETYTEGYSRGEMLVVSTENIELSSEGGVVEIDVKALCPWDVTSDEDWTWVHSSLKSGEKGSSKIKLTFDQNRKTQKRESVVTIGNDKYDVSHDIIIQQEAFKPEIVTECDQLLVNYIGVTKTIEIGSNIEWVALCKADWITVAPTNGSNGQTDLVVTVAPNSKIESRTANIYIYSEEYDLRSTIRVSQEEFDMQFSVNANELAASFEGETIQLSVSSNVSWEATCEADWVTLSPSKGDVGVTNMSVTTGSNVKTEARTAIIKILCANSGYTEEILITQAKFVPNISLSNITSSAEGGTRTIAIKSNVAWSVSCEAGWVKLHTTSGEAPNANMIIEVLPNTATISRTTSLVFYNENYNYTKRITVEQSAFIPQINTISSITSSAEGGTRTISINSNVSWSVSCEAGWIALSVTNGVAGSTKLAIHIAANNAQYREASIKIENNSYAISKAILVAQYMGECVIVYTSNSGVISPNIGASFNANIVSNTYKNGQGVLVFDAPLTSIGDEMFYAEHRLVSITLPSSIVSIGVHAFVDCRNLKRVNICDLSAWYTIDFNSNPLFNNQVELYLNDELVTNLVVPTSVSLVKDYSFCGCASLKHVEIPDHVSSIGEYAFAYCDNITTIEVGAGVKYIGGGAFYASDNVKEIYFKSIAPPEVKGDHMFNYTWNVPDRKIYVPRVSVNAYKEAPYWRNYASQIVGYDF